MVKIVEFKSWRDTYLFLLNYGTFSCLNCKYCGHNLDLSADNSEFAYSHHFCSEWVSMVDFNFQFVCEKWTDTNGNNLQGREDECVFNLSDEVIKKLSSMDKKWSFEEIEELIYECEETIE